MTNSPDHCSAATEYENWVLHRQPADHIVDHKFSIWSGEYPLVLANEMPGEEGILAYIVSVLNGAQSSDGGVEARHAEAGNKAGSIPEEARYPSATRLVREEVQGAALQPCAGVASGPSDHITGDAQCAVEWSDEDYKRARDCMRSILQDDYRHGRNPLLDLNFDNAFQHAVGILSLSARALAAQPPAAPVETERCCKKCGAPTKGEEAYVNGQIWCHPCADSVSPCSADTAGQWCQPMDNGKHTPRKFLLYFEDADRGIAVFNDEAEAREAFTKANTAWNCYLFGAMPLNRDVPQRAWTCAARKQGTLGGNAPADCDWPGCGCDPAANKVLEAIDEAGFEITKKPEPTPWDANHNRSYEPVETLAKEIYDGFVYDGPAGTKKPTWTPGGNGTKQDDARFEARRRLRDAGHTSAVTRPELQGGDK